MNFASQIEIVAKISFSVSIVFIILSAQELSNARSANFVRVRASVCCVRAYVCVCKLHICVQ